MMYNSVGRHADAMTAAAAASAFPDDLVSTYWGLAELIEAAARSGRSRPRRDGSAEAVGRAVASGTDWALGIEARCRALLTTGAERRRPLPRGDRTAGRHPDPHRARPHTPSLRRVAAAGATAADARDQLRTAHEMFVAMGIAALADRAGSGLRAAGASVRRRRADTERRPDPAGELRSRGWLETGSRTWRSAHVCSSVHAPWNGTSATCSPSSASPHATT